MKYWFYLLVVISLASCGGFGDLVPSFDMSKDKNITGGGTGGQGVGELSADFNLSDNNSKNYNRSNIDSNDTSNSSEIDQSDSKYSFGGTHYDNSNKNQKNTIKSSTNDDTYIGKDIRINKSDLKILSLIIFTFVLLIFFFVVWTLWVYRLGRNQMSYREKKIITEAINKTYGISIDE